METQLQDYENRKFMIFNVSELELIDFTQVCENVIFDDVQLAGGTIEYPNLRVLELNLNDGDVVSTKDNNLVTYSTV
jgi:hypothetical protein